MKVVFGNDGQVRVVFGFDGEQRRLAADHAQIAAELTRIAVEYDRLKPIKRDERFEHNTTKLK